MENKKIALLDTSVLIDYYRKKDKSKSYFVQLSQEHDSFCVSAITIFEIFTGATPQQQDFWTSLFETVTIIPFSNQAAQTAAELNKKLKTARKQIDKADLFIAATAISQQIPMATLNKKHFERIDDLQLLA